MPTNTGRWIGNAVTTVLVLCAVTMTTIAVRRELGASSAGIPQAKGIAYTPTRIASPPDPAVGNRIGAADAPITFVEFSDFQCPYCAALDHTLDELRTRYPDRVSIVYRHYLSPAHPYARPAAIAAECAGEQHRFAEFASLLFRSQDSIGVVAWTRFARQAGVADLEAFARCQRAPEIARRVDRDQTAGARLGISATPALVLSNQMLVGALPIDQLEAWIQSAGYRVASR